MRQDFFRLPFYFNWDRTGVFLVEVGWERKSTPVSPSNPDQPLQILEGLKIVRFSK